MLHNHDYQINSFVHTAELSIEKPNMGIHNFMIDKRIKSYSISKDERRIILQYNPNSDTDFDGITYWKSGDCDSLSDFELSLCDWAYGEGLNREEVDVRRIDFAINFIHMLTAEHYHRLSQALIHGFISAKHIKPKEQYWGYSVSTMQEKNLKAKWRRIEFELYYKQIQDPLNQAIWRLELRYGVDWQRNKRKAETPLQMLEKLKAEVLTLKNEQVFQTFTHEQNICLLADFKKKYGDKVKPSTINLYVSENRLRFFSTEQLQEFFFMLSFDSKHAVRNYRTRHKGHDFITCEEYCNFVQLIVDIITDWIENEARWGDKYSISI